MKALIDLQALLWYARNDARLPEHAEKWMASPENTRVLSAVAAWELIIKCMAGKLNLHEPPAQFIERVVRELQMQQLPVAFGHVFGVSSLPPHHHDLFDRLLVAQAQIEGLPIVTGDPLIRQYGVRTIW